MKKNQPASPCAKRSSKKNLPPDVQLKAWNLWKAVCSFHGCSPQNPLIQRRIQAGKGTREAYTTLYNYLAGQVIKRFNEAMSIRCRLLSDTTRIPSSEILDIVDDGMCELKQQESAPGAVMVKAYKDALWHRVSQSPDPPAQVIFGSLRWRIVDIVREYIKKNYAVMPKTGTSYLDLISVESMQAPVNDEEGLRREEVVPDEKSEHRSSKHWVASDQMMKDFYESLDSRERIVLLAIMCGVNVTDPLVEKALGVKRDRCSAACVSLKKKIGKMPSFSKGDGLTTLKNLLFAEFESEKVAEPFFKELEAQKKKEEKND
ncbi:MAG: hypothetical protein MJ016_03210 [Victivallaceae bacterium]|nr:hypothetical protein [Victivallaceae bacterium]